MRGKKEELLPDSSDIQEHFSKLYTGNNDTNSNNFLQDVNESEKIELTEKITLDEIKLHIGKAKNKKAAGKDGISNEILKDSSAEMLNLYESLFNKIIERERYPTRWNTSITQIIHKEGPRDEPENFRGTALTSNLSKNFNAIMNTRINNYLEENNLIAIEQGGFRRDHRTTDHIFVLQSIVQQYLDKGVFS